MFQKVKLISVSIVLVLILSGCQEVDRTELINKEETWNYYLIDAVSGEYFTGIDVGEIEG